MVNILLVDDEKEILELMEVYLENDGYNIFKSTTGTNVMEIIENNNIHLVVLDIMMPDIDGIHVCMQIRKKYNIPIIMVSAKSQDSDKIYGISTGADDYITKPFNPIEFVVRVKSQIRRYMYFNKNIQQSDEFLEVIEFNGIRVNMSNHKITKLGKEVKLTPKEYEILLLLATNRGKVFSSEYIFEKVWKEKSFDSNNTVMVHMWRLREKLEENPKEPKIIETVWGVGYKIEKE